MRQKQRKTCGHPSLRHTVSEQSPSQDREYNQDIHQPQNETRKKRISEVRLQLPPKDRKREVRAKIDEHGINKDDNLDVGKHRRDCESRSRQQLRHKYGPRISP